MTYFTYILIGVLQIYNISAFQTSVCHRRTRYTYLQQQSSESSSQTVQISSNVDFNSLMIMDVVLFQRNDTINSKLEMGAVQENGNVAPFQLGRSSHHTHHHQVMMFWSLLWTKKICTAFLQMKL